MRNSLLLLVLGFVLFACVRDNQDEDKNYAEKHKLSENSNISYLLTKNLGKELNLPDLEHSNDSLEIRIWIKEGPVNSRQLNIIKKIDNKDEFFWYWFYDNYEKPIKYHRDIVNIRIDSFECHKFHSDSTNYFIDSLLFLGIENLPNQDEIPDFKNLVGDGTSFTFEIKTNNGYRFFEYHCPDYYNDKYNKAANKILQFLR
ncbi:MAG: hypothetical protein ACXWD4_14015, partial [Bacteroidia bacterium]